MSVPHLDTRVIDGKEVLLFGPFATFSTKFLKNGSLLDMFAALTTHNIMPMTHAGIDNIDLSTYLMGQLMLSFDDRMAACASTSRTPRTKTGNCCRPVNASR